MNSPYFPINFSVSLKSVLKINGTLSLSNQGEQVRERERYVSFVDAQNIFEFFEYCFEYNPQFESLELHFPACLAVWGTRDLDSANQRQPYETDQEMN